MRNFCLRIAQQPALVPCRPPSPGTEEKKAGVSLALQKEHGFIGKFRAAIEGQTITPPSRRMDPSAVHEDRLNSRRGPTFREKVNKRDHVTKPCGIQRAAKRLRS